MLGRKKGSEYRGGNYKDHSFIARNAEFIGDVTFLGGLHVEGKVVGNIRSSDGAVHVHGEVQGEIQAPHIIINGVVTGTVVATDHLELAPKAQVTGTVFYRTMEMSLGAQINGTITALAQGQLIEAQAVEASLTGDQVAAESNS